jgi:flagellar hook protein FlgE
MSFQTGLSGLNTSRQSLDVIGNNIANANTVGFKSSRSEFSELVASSLGAAGGGGGVGLGASTATVAQMFTQGSINITGNSLDVAINGGGFFQVEKPDGSTAFTRDGQFKISPDGYIMTNAGANVMGYPTDTDGVKTSNSQQKMQVPSGAPIAAQQTATIKAELNLDARSTIAANATPPTPLGTYGTSITAFDSQGVTLPVSVYFSRLDPATSGLPPPAATGANTDQWAIYDTSVIDMTDPLNPIPPTPIGYLAFDSTGALAATYDAALTETTTYGEITHPLVPAPPSIVPTFDVTLDFSKATQYGIPFNVANLTQDGFTAGDLTGVSIEPSGIITTRYSNGITRANGQLSLSDFRNVQGLKQLGAGEYQETITSGQPLLGSPGSGKFGELRSGAVEESNVDLTAELISMMTAQRNYQANAQTIKTQDQVMSTLVNLR